MSFILDALKRADRERRSKYTPDLSALYLEESVPRRRRWPWLVLGGVLLINVCVLSFLFWPKEQSPASFEKDMGQKKDLEVSRVRPPTADPQESRPLQRRRISVEKAPKRGAKRPLIKEAQMAEKKTPVVEEAAEPKARNENEPEKANHVPDSQDRTDTSDLLSEEDESGPVSLENDPGNVDESEISSPELGEEEKAEDVDDAIKAVESLGSLDPLYRIPLLNELPLEIQKRLGKMEINVHAYYEDPKKSFLFLNMKSYRVGDRLHGSGALLERIIPDGAVINYGEGRARLLMGIKYHGEAEF